jgi:hypothetical protein
MKNRIDIDNKLKQLPTSDWLTPSQKVVFEEIKSCLSGTINVINLYGHSGVGKTFLIHTLYKKKLLEYCPSVETIFGTDNTLAIDNSPHDRMAARDIRIEMRVNKIKNVILISRYKVDDNSVTSFQLAINDKDIEYFKSNYFREFKIKFSNKKHNNYWEFMKEIGDING